ncbi:MAG: hypothetical protein JNM57_09600 [Cyclobacteriaceae bacterium]|nr:hypothetical protein [Cyclobacteriaceae bacterium]
MKKLLFIFASLMLLTVVNTNAQEGPGNDDTTLKSGAAIAAVQEKVKINVDELPDAIKTTLTGDNYKDWEVVSAYELKSKSQYEVEVKKGAETKTLKFSADGKEVTL